MRPALGCICALLVLVSVAGCGGDDGDGNTASQPAPATTGTQGNPQRNNGKQTDTNTQQPATPESRRTTADLRGQLRQGGDAGDIVGVDIGRTVITIRTRLTDSQRGREAASSICAETRRFIAQRPALGTAGRVTITGRAGAVITEC